MTIEAQEPAINGELIKLTRESRGWALGDLATRSCMSIRQIRQLEEGGTSSFYSVGVKVTAAKRVASLLGLTPEQVFEIPKARPDRSVESLLSTEGQLQPDTPLVVVSPNVMVSQAESDALSDVSSPLDETVHQASALKTDVDSRQVLPPVASATSDAESDSTVTSEPVEQVPEPEKSKVSFAAIFLLFAAALGVAAVMRPELESVGVESVPPVLALPNEEAPQVSPSLTPASVVMAATEASSAVASASQAKTAGVSASASGAVGLAASASAQPRAAASGVSPNALAASAAVASQPRAASAALAASGTGSSAKSP